MMHTKGKAKFLLHGSAMHIKAKTEYIRNNFQEYCSPKNKRDVHIINIYKPLHIYFCSWIFIPDIFFKMLPI